MVSNLFGWEAADGVDLDRETENTLAGGQALRITVGEDRAVTWIVRRPLSRKPGVQREAVAYVANTDGGGFSALTLVPGDDVPITYASTVDVSVEAPAYVRLSCQWIATADDYLYLYDYSETHGPGVLLLDALQIHDATGDTTDLTGVYSALNDLPSIDDSYPRTDAVWSSWQTRWAAVDAGHRDPVGVFDGFALLATDADGLEVSAPEDAPIITWTATDPATTYPAAVIADPDSDYPGQGAYILTVDAAPVLPGQAVRIGIAATADIGSPRVGTFIEFTLAGSPVSTAQGVMLTMGEFGTVYPQDWFIAPPGCDGFRHGFYSDLSPDPLYVTYISAGVSAQRVIEDTTENDGQTWSSEKIAAEIDARIAAALA